MDGRRCRLCKRKPPKPTSRTAYASQVPEAEKLPILRRHSHLGFAKTSRFSQARTTPGKRTFSMPFAWKSGDYSFRMKTSERLIAILMSPARRCCFGQRVMLIEGIAEALLMPEFARILFGSDEQERRRFRSASVIGIAGVFL